MTFNGMIDDSLRGTIEYENQLLTPIQAKNKELEKKIEDLLRQTEQLKRDRQFLQEQVEVTEIVQPADAALEKENEMLK